MSKWKGAVMVLTAHKYVVEAESYDEAREKIVELFENGEPQSLRQMFLATQKTYERSKTHEQETVE
jgi:hypothetical protein